MPPTDDSTTPPSEAAANSTERPRAGILGWLKLITILIVIPAGALALLWRGRCTESSLGEVLSADGLFAAETLTKDCGSSMQPATIVRVVERREGQPVDREDLLIVHGKVPVDVAWSSASVLDVGLPKDAVIVSRRDQWRHMSVRYK
jgi:hypothetical protein